MAIKAKFTFVLVLLIILVPISRCVQADEVLNSSLLNATSLGDAVKVRGLLNQGASANAKNTANGYSALMGSVIHGDTTILKMLLEAGADVNATTTTGETALLYAVMAGNSAAVEMLVSAGADKDAPTSMGISPRSMAKTMDNINILPLFADGPSVSGNNEHEKALNTTEREAAVVNQSPKSKQPGLRVNYDRFSNRLNVSSSIDILLPTSPDALILSCSKSYGADELARLSKNKKVSVPINLGIMSFGYTRPRYLGKQLDYIVDGGPGKWLLVHNRKSERTVIANLRVRVSTGFAHLKESEPIYSAILGKQKIEMRINFENEAPFLFTFTGEALSAFAEVIAFDAAAFLEKEK